MHTSKVVHKTSSYLLFLLHEAVRSISITPLKGMPVHHRATPGIKFPGAHLHTWVETGTVSVKSLAQEHNTMFPARDRTRTVRS